MTSPRNSETPGSPNPSSLESHRLRWERLAQISSRNFAVRLGYGPGHGTDGRQVTIESGPGGLTERGETLHEAAHLRAQSPRGRRRLREVAGGASPGESFLLQVIWHALEDARAEEALLARYPGAAIFLDHRAEADFQKDTRSGGLPPLLRLAWGVYGRGRKREVLSPDPAMQTVLGKISPLVERGVEAESPEEAADAALEIFKVCRPLFEVPGVDDFVNQEGTPEAESGEESEAGEELQTGESGDGEEQEQAASFLLDPEDLATQCFAGTPWLDRDAPEKEIHPDALAPDERTHVIPPEGPMGEYLDIFAGASNEVFVMIRRLQRMIRERQYVRYAGAYRSGRLQLSKVWKQRTGNYRLFQRKIEPDPLDVAFSLLVDESGSMNRKQKYLVARQAAVLCAEALEGIAVPFEVIGYSTEASEAVMAHNYGHVPVFQHRHIRHSRLQHRLYKTFEEAYRSVRTRLIHVAPRFNNWDEEHLAFAARRLSVRPESVRVVIIISDGQPNGNVFNLIETVAELEQRGFRIIAVGIEDDYVQEIYPNHVVVQDMSQLAEELINLLEGELLGRRRFPHQGRTQA